MGGSTYGIRNESNPVIGPLHVRAGDGFVTERSLRGALPDHRDIC